MAATLFKSSTGNAFNTTLNGTISDSDDTITLTTTSGLQTPGVVVIDRIDANDEATPTVREYVSFTGISSSDLTGCTRGLGGSVAQEHSSSAKVEEVFSISHWNSMIDFLQVSHDSDGKIVTSLATIAQVRIVTHLNASGASISGRFPIHPTWFLAGNLSLATVNIGSPAAMPQAGKWDFFSVTLRAPASGATMILDVNKNFSSIFDAATRLYIPGGGTYVSTASINLKTFSAGDVMSVDIDQGGGLAKDATVVGKGV